MTSDLRDRAEQVLGYTFQNEALLKESLTHASVADNRLNLVLMSIAGVEARHAALLGTMTGQTLPAGSLAPVDKAVAPGTGV